MITARGIYNNLEESTYSFTIYNIVFYFSSQNYKNKFKQNVESFVKYQTEKLKNFYKIEHINFDRFLAISYYKQIEKRGFRIIVLDGEKRFEKTEVFFNEKILI